MNRRHHSRGLVGIEADMHALGFEKVGLENPVRLVWRIACSRCAAREEKGYNGNKPPEGYTRGLVKEGWTLVTGKPPLCPICGNRRKPPPPSATALVSMVDGGAFIMPTLKPDISITVDVTLKLHEVFDKVNRMYHHGWDDARVAKDCATLEKTVAEIRNEKFGKLAEDPEIVAMRGDIEKVREEIGAEISGWKQVIADLSITVEKVRKDLQENMAEPNKVQDRCDNALMRLRERLDDMSKVRRPLIKVVK